jgi:hypothetical protein
MLQNKKIYKYYINFLILILFLFKNLIINKKYNLLTINCNFAKNNIII